MHKLDLKDCLEIWRRINEDNQNFDKHKDQHNEEDPLNMNEF